MLCLRNHARVPSTALAVLSMGWNFTHVWDDGMKIGILLPQWTRALGGATPGTRDLLDFARSAEEVGFDSVWLIDHLYYAPFLDLMDQGFQMSEERKGVRIGVWECWTTLAALAVATERVRIGTMVTNTGYRNPALLAHMAETVDDLSNGRLILGLGAGDFQSEHTFHGYPWERRVGRFEESLQIIKPLLKGERLTFEGEFYQTQELEMKPRGPRPDGPPILIGLLHGGPRMQRLVAQHADIWNCWFAFGDSRPHVYPRYVENMVAACERHGRDPATLRRSVTVGIVAPGHDFGMPGTTPLTGPPDEVAAQLVSFAEQGVDHITFYPKPFSADGLDWFGRVLEEVRQAV